jgi:hypothetical protein
MFDFKVDLPRRILNEIAHRAAPGNIQRARADRRAAPAETSLPAIVPKRRRHDALYSVKQAAAER